MSTGPAIAVTIKTGPSKTAQIRDDSSPWRVIISASFRVNAVKLLAAAIGRVAPGRRQQRDVIVRCRISHAELDHGLLDEWRFGQYGTELRVVFGEVEHQFILADLHGLRGRHWCELS